MKMTVKRVLFFLAFVLLFAMVMQQYWQSKSATGKWLYLFGDVARDYAGDVLGQGRGTDVPVPEKLAGAEVSVHDSYVAFYPKNEPDLVLAFSPAGNPDAESAGQSWSSLGDGWYVLSVGPQ